MNYLGNDMKFKRTTTDAIRSSLNFLFAITPRDIPLNDIYGVVVPTDIKVEDFCRNYKENLTTMVKNCNLGVTIGNVWIEGRLLKIDITYNDNSMETWDLTV